MLDGLPTTIRYVKIGTGGRWWETAKAKHEVHLGWSGVPHVLLQNRDLTAIRAVIKAQFGPRRGATQDFNALLTVLDRPSQHIWITFQDGCMWWCTVRDEIELNSEGESQQHGHFWLKCDRPWSNHSIGGRHLATANLPGIVTTTAGYQATVCRPGGWQEILRIVRDEEDSDAVAAAQARGAYEAAIGKLVARLRPHDFELLVDLILSRTGWVRLAKLGGATEGIDVEVENVAAGETAFVQVKGRAAQNVLEDYVERFSARRERYQRMIFAVHTPIGVLLPPAGQPIQVWTGERVAELVVRLGLGEWVARRV
jgi:hypothetical protein